MSEKRFKVSKEEYELINVMKRFTKEDFDLLSTIKENDFTLKDIKDLERTRVITNENKQRTRLDTIKNNNLMIKHQERAIEYKQGQVDKKESLEKEEKYIDGKKPIYMIINEMEQIQAHVEQLKEVNTATQKEYDDGK